MKRLIYLFVSILLFNLVWFTFADNSLEEPNVVKLNDILDTSIKQKLESKVWTEVKDLKDYLNIRYNPTKLRKFNKNYVDVDFTPVTNKKTIEELTSIEEEGKYLLVYDDTIDKIIGVVSLYDNVILPWFIKGTKPDADKTFFEANANLEQLLDNIEKEKDNNVIKKIKGIKIFVMNKKIYENNKKIFWMTFRKLGENANPLKLTMNFVDGNWNTIDKNVKIYWIYDINNGVVYYVKDWKKFVTNFNYKSDDTSALTVTDKANTSTSSDDTTSDDWSEVSLFTDEKFVKCLRGDYDMNGVYKINNDWFWELIKLQFDYNWDGTWTLKSDANTIDNVDWIKCNWDDMDRIDIFWKNIENIDWIDNFKKLTQLYLPNNNISNIPDSILNLTNLENLDLSNNNISSIPDSILNLTNLEWLYLRNNNISNISDSIWNLTNLKYLYLDYNNISNIPDSILNLTNLKRLDLSNNDISSIPDSILNLTNLENLDLSNNDISSIPSDIWNLTNLTVLELENNNLKVLPKKITNLTKLESLSLSWNPDLWNLNKSFTIFDRNEYQDTVIDSDWDWINDTVLHILWWNPIKLWTE